MKIMDLIQSEICYFRFEIGDIPFKEAGINFEYQYAYARFVNNCYIHDMQESYFLCGIYNYFSNEPIKDPNLFKYKEFIIPQHLCTLPKMRGENNWTFIGSEPIPINIELPQLTGASYHTDEEAIKEYFTNGLYVATFVNRINLAKTEKTKYRYIKHLEGNEVLGAYTRRTDLFVELLKTIGVKFSDDELFEKMKIYHQKNWIKLNEQEIQSEFRHFKRLYKRPRFLDIPKLYRERAIPENVRNAYPDF